MDNHFKDFLAFVSCGLLLTTVILVGFFAIPLAVIAAVVYIMYRVTKPGPLVSLQKLRKQVDKKAETSYGEFVDHVRERLKYNYDLQPILMGIYSLGIPLRFNPVAMPKILKVQ